MRTLNISRVLESDWVAKDFRCESFVDYYSHGDSEDNSKNWVLGWGFWFCINWAMMVLYFVFILHVNALIKRSDMSMYLGNNKNNQTKSANIWGCNWVIIIFFMYGCCRVEPHNSSILPKRVYFPKAKLPESQLCKMASSKL